METLAIVVGSLVVALAFDWVIRGRARTRIAARRRLRAIAKSEAQRRKAIAAQLRLPGLHAERAVLEANMLDAVRRRTGTDGVHRAALERCVASIVEAEAAIERARSR